MPELIKTPGYSNIERIDQMPKFIKLTGRSSGDVYYFNVNKIVSFNIDVDFTLLKIDNGASFSIKETPKQIMEMINA